MASELQNRIYLIVFTLNLRNIKVRQFFFNLRFQFSLAVSTFAQNLVIFRCFQIKFIVCNSINFVEMCLQKLQKFTEVENFKFLQKVYEKKFNKSDKCKNEAFFSLIEKLI